MNRYICILFATVFIFLFLFCACDNIMKTNIHGESAPQPLLENLVNGAVTEKKIPEPISNKNDIFEEGKVTVNNSDFVINNQYLVRINEIINENSNDFGFYVIDMNTKMSFGYNAQLPFSTASTIKAGFALYCFHEIQAGNAKLDDKMTYKEKHYITGSGSTQNSVFGTIFTLKALLYRMIYNSDNIAYYMLIDYFGIDGYNKMITDLGVKNVISNRDKWGSMTPQELGLIWQEIYNYKDSCDEGAILWNYLTTNLYNEIKEELKEYPLIAHKSGWNQNAYHDAGVVFQTNNRSYVIVVMTDCGKKNSCIYDVIRCIDDIMKEYYES